MNEEIDWLDQQECGFCGKKIGECGSDCPTVGKREHYGKALKEGERMSDNEIILVPMTSEQLIDWISCIGGKINDLHYFPEREEELKDAYKEYEFFKDCLEGKEGLNKKEIKELYNEWYNDVSMDEEKTGEIREKLKRWIE